jgi:hypothetical protein
MHVAVRDAHSACLILQRWRAHSVGVQEDDGEGDVAGGGLLSHVDRGGNASDADGVGGGGGDGDLEGPQATAAAVLREAARWEPVPVELDDARLVPATSFDIIATLVGIYGDTLFVTEYKYASIPCTLSRLLCMHTFPPLKTRMSRLKVSMLHRARRVLQQLGHLVEQMHIVLQES